MSEQHHPKQLVAALTTAMEEAERVGSTGARKRDYAVEAVRAVAVRTLSVDDAALVETLAPHLVDALVAATKGLLHVNEKGETSLRCCNLM